MKNVGNSGKTVQCEEDPVCCNRSRRVLILCLKKAFSSYHCPMKRWFLRFTQHKPNHADNFKVIGDAKKSHKRTFKPMSKQTNKQTN